MFALTGPACLNYAAATDRASTHTLAALTAVELTVPACAALVPFDDGKGNRLPYPLRYALLVASVVMLDATIMMLWKAE